MNRRHLFKDKEVLQLIEDFNESDYTDDEDSDSDVEVNADLDEDDENHPYLPEEDCGQAESEPSSSHEPDPLPEHNFRWRKSNPPSGSHQFCGEAFLHLLMLN